MSHYTSLAGDEYLQHNQLPYRDKPVNLVYVKTRAQLKDYAAGGFHVSVKLGQALEDPVQSLWNEAAAAYVATYEDDGSMSRGLKYARYANYLADQAYAAQGSTKKTPDVAILAMPELTKAGFPFWPVVAAGIGYWVYKNRKKMF